MFLNYFCDFGFDYFRDKVKGCGHCENLIHDFSTAIWLILTDLVTSDSSVLDFGDLWVTVKIIEEILYQ